MSAPAVTTATCPAWCGAHEFGEVEADGSRSVTHIRPIETLGEQAADDDHELPDYFGSFTAAPDLAERSASILRAGLSHCTQVRHHGE